MPKSDVKTFLLALADLMDKHEIDAITATDEWQGYAECGQDVQIRIEHKTDYSFDPGFGQWADSDSLRKAAIGEKNVQT